jgi:2-succinyl-6-hydroxy-2,4-cyclohexadiene-1-carboxylate synthase
VAHGRDTTCVAFVPGFMQHGDTWAPVMSRVRRRWPTTTVEFETPSLEASLDAIARAARGGVVVGYSMGGRLALRAVLREPWSYRALVLLGATPGIEEEGQRRSRKAADDELASWMETAGIQAIVDHWERQPVFATQAPDLVERQRRGRMSHEPARLAAMLRATGQGVLPPVWHELHRLTMPVLAVAGERDDRYAQIAERMAREVPRGQAALVSDAGHAAHLEQPDEFSDLLLDFLDQHLG